MPKKFYNDNSRLFADWTTKHLKKEALAYYGQIYISECYNCKDLMAYDGIMSELDSRGIQYYTGLKFR